MLTMAKDNNFTSDEAGDDRSRFGCIRVEFSNDEFGEVRIRRGGSDTSDEGPVGGERDGTEEELRVSRHGGAAARCGRWGDEQWR